MPSPQLKIILVSIYIIILFMINNLIGYGVMFAILTLICSIIKMPIIDILKVIKRVLPIVIFTAIINLLFIDGEVVWSIGMIKISIEGIEFAILMVIRIIFLVWGSSILTSTSTPLELSKGIETLMKPLKKIGFPVKEFAMVMMISLRFIPIIEEETRKIIMAQKSRGANLDTKNIFRKLKLLNAIIIPLLISILRRSEQIAIAMESRCYNLIND